MNLDSHPLDQQAANHTRKSMTPNNSEVADSRFDRPQKGNPNENDPWDVFLPVDGEDDPMPEPGDFWFESKAA